jgi:hypothetical protein
VKVKISETVEVTDDERRAITGGTHKATRDEARAFIWRHGSGWRQLLARAEEYEQDLIGDVDQDLVDLI